MRHANLVLHCRSQLATRDEIERAAVHTPPATATWCPLPHHDFLNGVESSLQHSGLTIVSQAHGLSSDGNRYFGLLQVANGENAEDFPLVVGLRNSHDKRFPAGLVVGASIFVCDNLSFSGEVRLARKHTLHVRRDLPQLIDKAVGRLGDLRRTQEQRFAAYKSHLLTDQEAHDLVVRSLDARVIPVTQVPQVLREWRRPRHPEFTERTAWSLFNGFTEVLIGRLDALPARTTALHGLMDLACGLHVSKV